MKTRLLILIFCLLLQQTKTFELGLSYDDVLIVPQHSTVKSRSDISTKTQFTKNISINIPIISANMDTVTEAQMAIAIAQLGGIGIIHRFNTIEQQVLEVEKVKRYSSTVIKNPFTINESGTYQEAIKLMKNEYGVKSLLVTDNNKKLVGILTSRDMRFNPAQDTPIKKLMTPKEFLVVGKKDTTIEEAKNILLEHKLEKLPLINDDWTVAGLITSKDIYNKTMYPNTSWDKNHCLLVGAAIGVNQDALDRAEALIKAGADALVIDIAHADSDLAINIIKKVKEKFANTDIIAGNVATAQATLALIQAGADAIKVGIGPGSICTTRITTGSGYPQISAVIQCAQQADKFDIPVIADGGIKNSGDITKAIVAGASTVMLGSILAGTEESPGIPFIKNGKKYKVIRGMASFGALLGRETKGNSTKKQPFVPEGIEASVPYRGQVREVISQLLGGLRSGLSYCGTTNIQTARGKCNFIQITQAGMRSSGAHNVNEAI